LTRLPTFSALEYDSIASRVAKNLSDIDLTILDDQAELYNPVRAISGGTLLE